MEVTVENFKEALPQIIEDIKQADFISLDTEFSGIFKGGKEQKGANRHYTVEQRYEIYRKDAEKFQVLQLGICTVKFNRDIGAYVLKPYCFDVNPAAKRERWGLDREFVIQASAAKFLALNGLEFNRIFTKGIDYLRKDEEEKALKWELDAFKKKSYEGQPMRVDAKDEIFVESFTKELQEFYDNPEPEYSFININALNGGALSGYHRMLVHRVVEEKFPELSSKGMGTFVQITKTDAEKDAERHEERTLKANKEVADAVGLRHIIDAMREARIPLIGHNLLVDLVHIYHTFVAPIPDTLPEFKRIVHQDFPSILDTKHITTTLTDVNSYYTTLSVLHNAINCLVVPEIKIHPSHAPSSESAAHNAGFDALATAQVAIRIVSLLEELVERLGDWEKATEMMGTWVMKEGRTEDIEPLAKLGRGEGGKHRTLTSKEIKGSVLERTFNKLRMNGTEEKTIDFADFEEPGIETKKAEAAENKAVGEEREKLEQLGL